ncbi:MAG: response regulator transcription factor [Sideroxyarcus sp.]
MTNNLIIASSCQNRLASWNQGLSGFVSTTFVIDKLDALREEVTRNKPKVLLLDFDVIALDGTASLRSMCAETKTIIIGSDICEDKEWELLKVGVRGCCRSDSDPKFLRQVVEAVQQGELWIRRTLTCRLIDELGRTTEKNKTYRTSLGLLNKLTQREYDIAVRVGNGESNKQIAQACAITERTVKAHLTEVFLKLGVTDRLNLALVLSADERNNEFGNSGKPIRGGSRFDDAKYGNFNPA